PSSGWPHTHVLGQGVKPTSQAAPTARPPSQGLLPPSEPNASSCKGAQGHLGFQPRDIIPSRFLATVCRYSRRRVGSGTSRATETRTDVTPRSQEPLHARRRRRLGLGLSP